MPSNVLGDSNAILVEGRVLQQHQMILGIIRTGLTNPRVKAVQWLDLACGRGQILTSIEGILSLLLRNKIQYTGVDVVLEYARQTERRAQFLFPYARVQICELQQFELFCSKGQAFDIITLTNTAHELTPEDLANILVAALCRMSSEGYMLFYDMERLPELELGAIPWQASEIQEISNSILQAAGVTKDFPDVAVWTHSSCRCWHLQVHRNHFELTEEELEAARPRMVSAATETIRLLLERKLLSVHNALQAASSQGTRSPQEDQEVNRLLHDFWALSRVLQRPLELGFATGVIADEPQC